MKEVIQKAIEGGWNKDKSWYGQVAFLDPLFWQALGEAEGWKQVLSHGNTEVGDEEGCTHNECQEWFNQWHRFIDHIAEGKDIDSFFKSLLKSKE